MPKDFVGLKNHVLLQILSMDPSSTFLVLGKLNPLPTQAKTNMDTSALLTVESMNTRKQTLNHYGSDNTYAAFP